MQQKQTPYKYGQIAQIYCRKYLLIWVSFFMFSLLPANSLAWVDIIPYLHDPVLFNKKQFSTLETYKNRVNPQSRSALHTLHPGNAWGLPASRYVLTDNIGNVVNHTNDLQNIRKLIPQNGLLDVTPFQGDKQTALLHNLKLYDIAEGKAHFNIISIIELNELLQSPNPSLKIPDDNAIIVKNGYPEVTIPGTTTLKNEPSFKLTLRSLTDEAVDEFVEILRKFLAILRIKVRYMSDSHNIASLIHETRTEFKQWYPQYDKYDIDKNLRVELQNAAGATQIVNNNDSQKRDDFYIGYLKSWLQKTYKETG